jgi:autotransporter-associated beta strand protein
MTIGSTTLSVLDLGSAGIDMSAATANLVLNAVTNFSANQTWSIGSGRELSFSTTASNTGSAAVNITGPGTVVVTGTNVLPSGQLTLSGGIQLRSNSGTSRTLNNNITLNSDITLGSSAVDGGFTFGGNIDIGSANRSITLRSLSPSNTMITVGNGALNATVTGTGTLSILNGNASGVISARLGQSSGGGTTTISSDFLLGENVSASFGRTGVFTNTTDLTVNGRMRMGNLAGSGLAQTVKSLSGTGFLDSGQTTTANSPILTIDGGSDTYTTTFSGVIENGARGSVSVTKTGSTTQILSGNNTTLGAFVVNGGTLGLGHSSALGFGGPVQGSTINGTTVGSGGTLDLNGITGVSEPITLNGTGVGGNGALVNNSGTEAVISSGIAGLGLTAGGSGYSTAPTVTIGGTGSGATAEALLGVTAASFSISGGTTVYSAAPTVTITGDNGARATASATLTAGVVTGITISGAGAGFTAAPGITFSGGTVTTPGVNPTGTGNATNFTIGALVTSSAGTGYTGTPTVTFGSGGATGSAILSSVVLASDSSVGGSGNTTINAVVSQSGGARALTKVGAGRVTLNGVNTYSGATNVNGGTLLIGTTGSINSSSGVAVNAGNFRYDGTTALNRNVTLNGGKFSHNSASNYAGTLTFTSGSIGGTNLAGLNLTIGTGQTLAPGNSTGTVASGDTTWANGGTFQFEINDATGTAGSTTAGWDLANLTSLDITAGVGQFTIQIVSLDALQAAGLADNFNDATTYNWLFVDAGSAITGFSADKFVFSDAFTNATTGAFSVVQGTGPDTDKLYINYSAIPEPSTYAMLMGGLGLLAFLRRRSKS